MTLPALCFLVVFSVAAAAAAAAPDRDLVRSSCVHASYPEMCVRTLSSYQGPAGTPREVAQAAVEVSLTRATRISSYLASLGGGRRERGALRDCVEQLGESVEELRRTLGELKHLRGGTFELQMGNAQTWVSAALTNEDTCLDGFEGVGGKIKSQVRKKIANVARVTSNALCMINLLGDSRRSGHRLAPSSTNHT